MEKDFVLESIMKAVIWFQLVQCQQSCEYVEFEQKNV